MNLVLSICISCALVAAARAANLELDADWRLFKVIHKRHYSNKSHEVTRREIWESNLACINKHNLRAKLGQETYEVGMNHFGDLTAAEITATYCGYKPRSLTKTLTPHESYIPSPRAGHAADAENVDWRFKGIVTPVKQQGQCGSCWAFSAIGSLEGIYALKTGVLTVLSEQELVDCSRAEGNDGCDGGDMDSAYQYIQNNTGVDTDQSYPYTGEDAKCHANKTSIGATITGYVEIESKNETELTRAIAEIGPVSVGINPNGFGFHFYRSGIFYDPKCSDNIDDLDHAVVVVGYGDDHSEQGKYYIIKNSWSEHWGDHGYMKIARDRNNTCGIATQATYPKV